ncbi:hypothetical protein ACPCAC_04285 [Streptomyces lavendulocolor]|uniref:hypothetical protein n=1 Tax=Streptomyces lavendulocolor TaxID=67316 RepID=UPI003C2B3E14
MSEGPSEGPSDHPDRDPWHQDGDGYPEDDDAQPRRGRVVLVAVLVPLVGAAGGAAGPLFRGATSSFLPLLLVSAVVAFFLCFAFLSLSAVWLLDRASAVVAHVRAVRERRDRGR